MPSLHGLPFRHTFRAATFVQALKIPVSLHSQIIKRNNLFETIRQTAETRGFFESTNLFGEGVPSIVLMGIVERSAVRRYAAGEGLSCKDLEMLNVIASGKVERCIGTEVVDTLEPGDFFGEEGALFNIPCLYHMRVVEETQVYQIASDLIGNVSIVRWKLLESYLKRAQAVVRSGAQELEKMTADLLRTGKLIE